MGIVVVPAFGADPVTVTGPTLDAKVDGLATEFNGNIENANIKAGAAIANAKLNLASVAQDVTLAGTNVLSGATTISGALTQSGIITMTAKIFKQAKGADVDSVAGEMTLGDDGNYFDIAGTEAITSITAKTAGTVVILQFDSTASLVDGSNLKLNGNFTGAAEAQIMLVSDGTNWFEVARSTATQVTAASAAEVKTGTEAAKYVAPSTMIDHEGCVKGWINFNGTGTVAINDSYNVSGLTDEGTGAYTIAWDTDFGSANYAVAGIGKNDSDASQGVQVGIYSIAAGSLRVAVANSAGSGVDSSILSIMAIGDQ